MLNRGCNLGKLAYFYVGDLDHSAKCLYFDFANYPQLTPKISMKIVLILGVSLLINSVACGQVGQAKNLKELYRQGKYDEVIKYEPTNGEDLTAKDFYYKGMAYYMKSEDDEAMKYLNRAIEKGPVDCDMFFYKGKLLSFSNKFEESLPYFDKAIALLPREPDFYAGKGESYYALNNRDSAIVYFEKASRLPHCKTRVFLLMGEIYKDLKENENALHAYETALAQLTPNDESYQNCSFNLGLLQELTGKEAAAKETFEKHTAVYPEDFHAVAKLIQVYYSLLEFDKAIPFKEKLYAAHKAGKLPAEMNDMFCFDQFIWNNKRIMVFENFDEQPEDVFVKHHFYVMGDNGKEEYRIDSESSPAIRMNGPKEKYVLCLVKNGSYFTYWQYVFNDDYKYPQLKSAVLDILNQKVLPSAATIPGKKD